MLRRRTLAGRLALIVGCFALLMIGRGFYLGLSLRDLSKDTEHLQSVQRRADILDRMSDELGGLLVATDALAMRDPSSLERFRVHARLARENLDMMLGSVSAEETGMQVQWLKVAPEMAKLLHLCDDYAGQMEGSSRQSGPRIRRAQVLEAASQLALDMRAMLDSQRLEPQIIRARIQATLRRAVLGQFIFVGLLILFSATLFLWLYQQVAQPLRILARGTSAIAAGDLGHRVSVESSDEFGDLAAAFNEMAASLGESRNELLRKHDALGANAAALASANRRLAHESLNLRETQAQLVQSTKMATLGVLGAGLAHELNQPLTGIRGFAQMVRLKLSEGDPQARWMDQILRQSERMAKIINRFRTYARRGDEEMGSLQVNQVLRDALLLMETQLRNHNIQVELELPEPSPLVWGDANQLEQVFTNLAVNSLHALSQNGGGTLRMGAADGEWVLIWVEDDGPGIAEEKALRIFEPFFTTKGLGEGTGLGLSICRQIVERHSGMIELDHSVTRGARFVITLPAIDRGRALIESFGTPAVDLSPGASVDECQGDPDSRKAA